MGANDILLRMKMRGLMNDNLDLSEVVIQETAGTSHQETHGDIYWDFTEPSPHMTPIFMVRTLSQADPCADMEHFTQAKATEIEGLCNYKVREVVHEKDFSQDSNNVGGRFVLKLKTFSISEETARHDVLLNAIQKSRKR